MSTANTTNGLSTAEINQATISSPLRADRIPLSFVDSPLSSREKRILPLHRVLFDDILSFFFPTHCLGCDSPGEWFCEPCHQSSQLSTGLDYCQLCGRAVSIAGELCSFHQTESGLTGLLSYGNYQAEPIRQAINLAKYHGAWAGLSPLAERAWLARWQHLPNQQWTTIIPLTLDARRQRARGFNQSHFLAQVLSRHLGAPISRQMRRSRKTAQQVGLNRADRHRNMANVFAWQGPRLQGHVILVDDVVTTGATLSSAAWALKGAGAESVWACTLAYEALHS